MRLDSGTLTALLERMEHAGLVTRRCNTADQRVVNDAPPAIPASRHGEPTLRDSVQKDSGGSGQCSCGGLAYENRALVENLAHAGGLYRVARSAGLRHARQWQPRVVTRGRVAVGAGPHGVPDDPR
ncbi:MAG: MarR family transcriptional regulator [Rhodocyclaceae bacterium]|nr:MarR family transcriptional regulator [Rhodocyclaceae bacterium]